MCTCACLRLNMYLRRTPVFNTSEPSTAAGRSKALWETVWARLDQFKGLLPIQMGVPPTDLMKAWLRELEHVCFGFVPINSRLLLHITIFLDELLPPELK